jgi:hypothetical protein
MKLQVVDCMLQQHGNWTLLSALACSFFQNAVCLPLFTRAGPSSSAVDIPGERLMDDDAVLLADDEDMGALTASTLDSSPPPGDLGNTVAASPPSDDMVLVDDADVMQPNEAAAGSAAADASAASSSPASADVAMADADSSAAAAGEVIGSVLDAQLVSNNPFAVASMLPQPVSSAASESSTGAPADVGVTAAAESSPVSIPVPEGAGPAAAATVTVEKAPGELGVEGKAPARDSSSKRQAMSSHPVEVPEELT